MAHFLFTFVFWFALVSFNSIACTKRCCGNAGSLTAPQGPLCPTQLKKGFDTVCRIAEKYSAHVQPEKLIPILHFAITRIRKGNFIFRARRVGVFDIGTGRVGYLQKISGIGTGSDKILKAKKSRISVPSFSSLTSSQLLFMKPQYDHTIRL